MPKSRSRTLHAAPGMHDLLPAETALWERIERSARALAEQRGYRLVVTPLLEPTELFARGVGDTTDVVEKEMYTFEDKGGRSLSLRPEATASAVRAYFDGGLHQAPQPVRLHYWGPMFRYDRPQAGRYRQFFQFGVEAIGEATPEVDVETIELSRTWLERCGLTGVSLQLNSIGDEVCRPRYREALRDHFRPHIETMCADCRRRFDTNPLRLLDCRKSSCEPYQQGAPRSIDFLCEPCAGHHQAVREELDALDIPFQDNPRLVRGLDYYTRTTFEFWAADLEGAQNALGGGGRYDGLAEVLGYNATPAVGFAMGVDRVVLAMQRQGVKLAPRPTRVWLIPAAEGAAVEAHKLAGELRQAGWEVGVVFGAVSLKAGMRQAQKSGAQCVLIVGPAELESATVTVRDMTAGSQRQVARAAVLDEVDRVLGFPEEDDAPNPTWTKAGAIAETDG